MVFPMCVRFEVCCLCVCTMGAFICFCVFVYRSRVPFFSFLGNVLACFRFFWLCFCFSHQLGHVTYFSTCVYVLGVVPVIFCCFWYFLRQERASRLPFYFDATMRCPVMMMVMVMMMMAMAIMMTMMMSVVMLKINEYVITAMPPAVGGKMDRCVPRPIHALRVHKGVSSTRSTRVPIFSFASQAQGTATPCPAPPRPAP